MDNDRDKPDVDNKTDQPTPPAQQPEGQPQEPLTPLGAPVDPRFEPPPQNGDDDEEQDDEDDTMRPDKSEPKSHRTKPKAAKATKRNVAKRSAPKKAKAKKRAYKR